MGAVVAALEGAQAIVPPGPGQVDGTGGDPVLRGETAVEEAEAMGLLEAVSGSGGVSHAPSVLEGADLAVLKHRVTAAKDEVHRPLDEAAGEALAAGLGNPQPAGQEAVVPLNEVGGQGAQKQGVLGGGQAAAIHDEAVAVYAQRHLLALLLRA